MELMEASASPRKPRLLIPSRSSRVATLEVAWRDSASTSSSLATPQPLSRMRISLAPPLSMSISTRSAPRIQAVFHQLLTTEEAAPPPHRQQLVGQNRRQYTGLASLAPADEKGEEVDLAPSMLTAPPPAIGREGRAFFTRAIFAEYRAPCPIWMSRDLSLLISTSRA